MHKNRIKAFLLKQKKHGNDFKVPQDMVDSLRNDVKYLNFPFYLTKFRGGPTSDVLEVYEIIDGKLFYSRWNRGNCSLNFYKTSVPMERSIRDIPSLLQQNFRWQNEMFCWG